MSGKHPFNVRVYGLLFDPGRKTLLVSEETVKDHRILKFPGGGLQFGEGPKACIRREFLEECGLEVQVEEHFYTTDFFQASAFNPEEQVISIYYRVSAAQELLSSIPDQDEQGKGERQERCRWEPVERIGPERFDLPIDQEVARMVNERFNSRGSVPH